MIPIAELQKMSEGDLQDYLETLPDDQYQAVIQRLNNAKPLATLPMPQPRVERMNALQDMLGRSPKPSPVVPTSTPEGDSLRPKFESLTNSLSTLSGITGTMMDIANMSDPSNTEVKTGAISGALQGAASGAALGPMGAIGGAFIGAIGNAIKAGNQREQFEVQEEQRRRNMLTGLRVAPRIQETGGVSEDETAEEIVAQNEKGEVLLLPDGKLVDAMAKKTHKQMEGTHEVTDIQPNPTFVFSNSKKRLINLSNIKDHIFTITRGHYSEDGNTPMETITMGDVFGKKGKLTPAELVKKIRSRFPIVEKPVEAVQIQTNTENKRRRAELIRPIMQMQEGVYEEFKMPKPEKFEFGGFSKRYLRKNEVGGMNGTPGLDGCPPGHRKNAQGQCMPIVPTAELAEIDPAAALGYMKQLPEDQIPTALERMFDYNFDPSMRPIIPLPIKEMPVTTNDARGVLPRSPEEVTALPTRQMPVSSGTDALQYLKNRIDPQPSTQTASPGTHDQFSSDLFPQVKKVLDENSAQIDETYNELADGANKTAANASALYRRNRLRNLGILSSKLMGIAGQNPNVTPVRQGTEHIDSMFPEITETEIQGTIAPLRQGQSRLLESINKSGIGASRIGSAIASTQANVLEAESGVRGKALGFNKGQQSKRFSALRDVLTGNRASEVSAENATRSNRNQLVSEIGDVGARFIKSESDVDTNKTQLDQAIENRMAELKQWRQENKNKISQSQFESLMLEEERNLKKKWFERDHAYLRGTIDKMIQQFIG